MGMLASQPTGNGVQPPSTTIVDACTPQASVAEDDTLHLFTVPCKALHYAIYLDLFITQLWLAEELVFDLVPAHDCSSLDTAQSSLNEHSPLLNFIMEQTTRRYDSFWLLSIFYKRTFV